MKLGVIALASAKLSFTRCILLQRAYYSRSSFGGGTPSLNRAFINLAVRSPLAYILETRLERLEYMSTETR